MKRINRYLIIVFGTLILFSCENKLEMFNHDNGLNFIYNNKADSTINYSFVYGPSTAVSDTLWVKVETMGYIGEVDREIELEQIMTGANDAVAGTHFVAFDDSSLKELYKMPKGAITVTLPIILKRAPSLKTTQVTLYLKFKENAHFKKALPKRNRLRITISDQLSKPMYWAYTAKYFFGQYGPVKHQFLIDITGKRWDDDYLYNELGFASGEIMYGAVPVTNANYDRSYVVFYAQTLRIKLQEYNQQRINQGLDVLKEADGTIVTLG